MKSLFEKLFYSCTEAEDLIQEKALFGLSLTVRLRLFVHVVVCKFCRQYQRQSKLLEKAMRQEALALKKRAA
jgi:hypothetical protein